ncbi:hypothetical protein D5S17_00520 [Pseudonocardiaceae bacterium YIM PH 21723]|nr:hypothetical protein D5S17_00520 [Pseudonocardiaceae bacterium YIM PH 21723]
MNSDELLVSSGRWLDAGLKQFDDEWDPDFCVHHVAVAVEHLLKAYLVSLHPALIVDRGDWQSMLHATGHGNRSKVPASRTRSIGVTEAFDRVKELLPQHLTVTKTEFLAVAEARNGIAHVGAYEATEMRKILTTCFRVIRPLLESLGASEGDYWKFNSKLRDQLEDEHVTQVGLTVTAKIDRARTTAGRLIYRLNRQDRIAIIAALNARSPQDLPPFAQQVERCPACDGRGWLQGQVWVEEIGIPVQNRSAKFAPTRYQCAVCQLELEGDQLEPVGLHYLVDLELTDEELRQFYIAADVERPGGEDEDAYVEIDR